MSEDRIEESETGLSVNMRVCTDEHTSNLSQINGENEFIQDECEAMG